MRKKSESVRLPKGWTTAKVEALRTYYENQTEEEAVAEIEAVDKKPQYCMISVPTKLLPKIRKLLAAAEKN